MERSKKKFYRERWYRLNAPVGKLLGYPDCCIQEFCDLPPELMTGRPTENENRRLQAAYIDGLYTGFIPCSFHAEQILSGKITLSSLIKNRDSSYPPFPDTHLFKNRSYPGQLFNF